MLILTIFLSALADDFMEPLELELSHRDIQQEEYERRDTEDQPRVIASVNDRKDEAGA